RQADDCVHARHGGLGLGLAIVKHLVELHGGDIRAESLGEGCGATFVLRLPLAARRSGMAPPRHSPANAAPSLARGGGNAVAAEPAVHTDA
ncbi:MAG: ATP-binding protein, partial [Ramlibacter sp.]|nr:ATP-binding protein [Ramlibacter sp.]